MVPHFTLREVLQEAIHKEVLSRFLYLGLRQKVRNQAAKDAFQTLAEQEEVHQRFMEDYLHGRIKEGALDSGTLIDYRIAQKLEHPDISPSMVLKDVYLLAAQKEKMAWEFYSGLAAIHPPGQIKDLLQELASQELQHKRRVELLYSETAFPQTDGG
jgi:rubrerythrin